MACSPCQAAAMRAESMRIAKLQETLEALKQTQTLPPINPLPKTQASQPSAIMK